MCGTMLIAFVLASHAHSHLIQNGGEESDALLQATRRLNESATQMPGTTLGPPLWPQLGADHRKCGPTNLIGMVTQALCQMSAAFLGKTAFAFKNDTDTPLCRVCDFDGKPTEDTTNLWRIYATPVLHGCIMLKSRKDSVHGVPDLHYYSNRLHVSSKAMSSGRSVVHENSVSDGSKWLVEPVDGLWSTVMLKSVRSNYYLHVSEGATNSGDNVQHCDSTSEGSEWLVNSDDEGEVMLKSVRSSYYAHIADSNAGARRRRKYIHVEVKQSSKTDGGSKWKVEYLTQDEC